MSSPSDFRAAASALNNDEKRDGPTERRIRKRDVAKWAFFVGGIVFAFMFVQLHDTAQALKIHLAEEAWKACEIRYDAAEKEVQQYAEDMRHDMVWYEKKAGRDGQYAKLLEQERQPLLRKIAKLEEKIKVPPAVFFRSTDTPGVRSELRSTISTEPNKQPPVQAIQSFAGPREPHGCHTETGAFKR